MKIRTTDKIIGTRKKVFNALKHFREYFMVLKTNPINRKIYIDPNTELELYDNAITELQRARMAIVKDLQSSKFFFRDTDVGRQKDVLAGFMDEGDQE